MFCRFIFVFLHRFYNITNISGRKNKTETFCFVVSFSYFCIVFIILQTFREDEKEQRKKSYIVQQDNRIANEKDSFKRYERNVLYQAVRALQEKYPIKKLDDGTSIHAYNTNDIRSEIVTLTETRLLECLAQRMPERGTIFQS